MNNNRGESRISLLLGSTALAGVVAICLGPEAAAQIFTGNQTTSGPFAGGTQLFYNASALNASAAGAVTGGNQYFRDASTLNASAANAVSGGSQYLYDSSALNASATNAVSSGFQNFYGASTLNASAANAVSGGIQGFVEISTLDASAANAVSGGEQYFYNTSTLNTSAGSAISGGTQYFYDTSRLNASVTDAVSGGNQRFGGTSQLNASSANAVSGGKQTFYAASALNASATNAVSGGIQNFDGTSALNALAANALSGGNQGFYGASTLNATAASAVSGGKQLFSETSVLNASAANAVSGGTQIFHETSALKASAANAVSGGFQGFNDASVLNASAANAVSGGTQYFYITSTLNASAANAVSGGTQFFIDTSALNASAANAVSGGEQYFWGTSALNASAANAVSGGMQDFNNTSSLNASAANAVNGGTQYFWGTSALNASAANAVSGGTQYFSETSTLNVLAGNALTKDVTVNFDNRYSGPGGTLRLNGHSTVLGAVRSLSAGSGIIENGGAADSILTIDGSTAGNSSLSGLIRDGGAGRLGLALAGGTLTLSGMNTYTGPTTIDGGTLAITSTGGITSNVTSNARFENAGTVVGSVTNNAGAIFTQTGGSVSGGVINAGTVNANGGALNGAVANNAGGIFNVTSVVTGNSTFGNASGATLAVAATGDYTLAGLLTNSGLVTVTDGGALTANGGITNNGTLTIRNGGSVSASGVTIAANAGSTGTLNIGAGIGDPAAAPGMLSIPTVTFMAGNGRIVFNHTAASYAFAPTISGAGAVTVEAGTTILTGAGSSVGAVTVNGGKLEFGQAGTFTAASYTTQSGATTTIDGTAQLAVAGAFTQSAGSTLNVAIGANDPAITAATAALDGALNVSGYTGTQYTVIHTTGGIAGDFASVTIGGSSSLVDYLTATGGISGNDYIIRTGLTWDASAGGGNGVFTLTNGSDAFNVSVALTDQTGPFASGWDGKSLTKNGAGTLTLSEMNIYTGPTTINGGALAIAATGGITSSLTNNATFENAGTVAGSVTNNAGATFTQTGGSVSGGVINAGTANANGGALNGAIANNAGGIFNVGGTVTGNGAFGNASGATLAVTGTGSYTLAGVLTNNGGVTVDAGGALTASGGILNAASGVVTNNGTVTDDLANAGLVSNYGTYNAIVASNTGRITNTGTWNGNVVSSSGSIGNAGLWSGNIVNSGTFTNSGTASNGLTNSGNATTSGGVINGAIVNSGTFTVTGTTTGNGRFSNSGTFALSGGDFTGLASFTNNGLVTAANGGTLGAASFVNATGGIVDLRNGSATNVLNLAGSVTFNAGSIYKVEVNTAGQSDRIAATGTASLNGGTVQVNNAPGVYALGTRYRIATAGGGVSGQFSGLTQSSPLSTPFLAFGLNYDPNNVYLDVTRSAVSFASVGQTRNQIATGGGLDSVPLSISLVNAVAQLDMAAAGRVFDQLSGEVHASAKTALIEDSHFVRDAATSRIRAVFGAVGASRAPVMAYADPADGKTGAYVAFASLGSGAVAVAPTTDRFALWGQGFGSWGSTDSNGNAASLSHSTGGFLIGGDAPIFETWRLGMMAGYSRTIFNVRDRASSGTSDNYHLGLYGGTQWGNLGFRTGAAYTWHDVTTSRSVAFPGFGGSLKGDYRAGTAQVFGELGYGIRVGSFGFEPFVNLAYVNLNTDGFAENGGAAALRSTSTSTGVTFTTLGLHASTDFALGETAATLRSTLGWRHAFGDTTPFANFAFAGGSPFTVAGVPIAKDALVLDVGLDVAIARNTTLGISYGGQYGGNAIDQSVRAKFNVRF